MIVNIGICPQCENFRPLYVGPNQDGRCNNCIQERGMFNLTPTNPVRETSLINSLINRGWQKK